MYTLTHKDINNYNINVEVKPNFHRKNVLSKQYFDIFTLNYPPTTHFFFHFFRLDYLITTPV